MARLREPRVTRLLSPMLAGDPPPADLLGLGLVVVRAGALEIANPIYREILPRALTYVQQIGMHQHAAWYLAPDAGLDMTKLMHG